MAHGLLTRTFGFTASHVPGLRRIPVLKLLAAAELTMLARDHLMKLDRSERRRLFELVRIGRGRRRNLTESEREELARLIALMEPRLLAGHAADMMSPVPLPKRVVNGPRRAKTPGSRTGAAKR